MSLVSYMIPDLPPSVSDTERLDFYDKMLSNLEDQSTIHVNWHTHKQNPAVCWICDIPILARKVMYIMDKILSKSPLDMVTELSSDRDSEPEIDDESLNNDEEERTPEYDVEEDALYTEPSGEQDE